MRTALQNATFFDHQDLLRAPNRGQPMRDNERRAPLHQEAEPVLNHGLALRIEGAGRLIQNQNAGIGQDRPCDRQTLPLTAGELNPTLAHDRLIALSETLRELVYTRDTAGLQKLFFTGLRPRKHDVLADGAVEQKRLLQYDAQLAPVRRQLHLSKVDPVHQDTPARCRVERAHQADHR